MHLLCYFPDPESRELKEHCDILRQRRNECGLQSAKAVSYTHLDVYKRQRQQQVAGIGFFAAKVPGKLHRTAPQLIRLVRKALVPAKAKFLPNTHLPAPC